MKQRPKHRWSWIKSMHNSQTISGGQGIDVLLDAPRRTLCFNLPAGRTSLAIRCELKAEKAFLSIRLYNPRGQFIGEMGYGTQTMEKLLVISPELTTKNALLHELVSGEYQIIIDSPVSALKADAQNAVLRLSLEWDNDGVRSIIEMLPDYCVQTSACFDAHGKNLEISRNLSSQARYYRGDFHGHTNYSDGKQTDKQAAETLGFQNMDFMALTEHNSMAFGREPYDQLIIPSFELTLPSAHVNVFGVADIALFSPLWDAVNDCAIAAKDPLPVLMQQALQQGYVLSLNHMFLKPWHCTTVGMQLRWLTSIEIICDPTYPGSEEANQRAIDFLDYLWTRRRKVYAIGGSDSHNLPEERYEDASLPSIYGDPMTWVHCPGLSVSNICQAVQAGHMFVTRHIALEVEIAGGAHLPGDELQVSGEELEYELRVTNFGSYEATQELEARFLVNGVVVYSAELNANHRSCSWSCTLPSGAEADFWWARSELRDSNGQVVAFVNPVFCGSPLEDQITVDQLIVDFSAARNEPLNET